MDDNAFYFDRYKLSETSCQKMYAERNLYNNPHPAADP